MAEFCKQCATELFGEECSGDFVGMTTKEDEEKGEAAVVLCGGCGAIQVNSQGECISKDCLKQHE